jgi:glycosyltransferase involved in cell wall biosynthesis
MEKFSFQDLHILTLDLPPITLLSFSCQCEAGTAAVRILEGLLSAGADARMFTFQKGDITQERIIEISDKGKSLFIKNRVYHGIILSKRYPSRPNGYESFVSPVGCVDLSSIDVVRNTGLFHLQRLENLIGWPEAPAIFMGKPVVWTMHSMPAFTSGCSYTAGCEKFINGGCENCPQLGSSVDGKDLAAENFAVKRTGYTGVNMTVVAPSRWLGENAYKSILLGSFPREIIPNGIDLDAFSPMVKNKARARLGLPSDKRIILFSASDANRRNKGYHILVEVLTYLLARYAGEPLALLVLGMPPKEMPHGYEYFMPGFIDDKTKLAAVYSAADIFVLPSFQDNLPTTLIESQACGTPGIGFYGTGAEDIIQDGVTGYLAKHPGLPLAGGTVPSRDGAYRTFSLESIKDFAMKIKKILELPKEKYAAMRYACREHALTEYSLVLQAERYLRLYRKVLGLPENP